MIKSLLHLMTFNLFKKDTFDELELFKKCIYISFSTRTGTSEKEMRKFLTKAVGKNLEYILPSLGDGLIDLLPNSQATFANWGFDDFFNNIKESRWHQSWVIVGKGSKFLKKVLNGAGSITESGFYIMDTTGNSIEEVLEGFDNVVFHSMADYRIKSGDRSFRMPDTCKQCSAVFISPGAYYDKDEPFGEEASTGFAFLDPSGCCNVCGHHNLKTTNFKSVKWFKKIREFEDSTGVSLLPKCA